MTPARWIILAAGVPVVLALIGWTGFTVIALAATDVAGDNGSGNITLTFTKVPKRVDVTDESGDITLVLPPGPTAYQVVTQSTSVAPASR